MEEQDGDSLRKQSKRQRKHKDIFVSRRFAPRFWETSDSRISVVKLIRRRVELLKAHAGGEESIQRDLLCQRAAFVSLILETAEVEAAEGKGLDMSCYVSAVNCLQGLLRALGLEKRVKSAGGLQAYLNGREAK